MKRIDTWRVTAYEQKENHYHNNRWHDCMKKDGVTGALVPALSGEALIDTVPGIDDGAHIEVREFSNIPSEYMTLDRMGRLLPLLKVWILMR